MATILGAIIGSFLNVVAYRVPLGISLSHPPSTCPKCDTRIKTRHNIPIVGWFMLRGKCYNCKNPISPEYPIVEAFTAVAFGITTYINGVNYQLLPLLYLVAITIPLVIIDLKHRRLPNVIVGPAYIVTPLLYIPHAWNTNTWGNYLTAALGLVIFFILYFVISLYPRGMGLGDVKLSGILGFYIGWQSWQLLALGFFAPFFLGSIYAGILLIMRRATKKNQIPFGPWMLAGTWLTLAVGQTVWDAYLNLIT